MLSISNHWDFLSQPVSWYTYGYLSSFDWKGRLGFSGISDGQRTMPIMCGSTCGMVKSWGPMLVFGVIISLGMVSYVGNGPLTTKSEP